jgi:hypothetical protein
MKQRYTKGGERTENNNEKKYECRRRIEEREKKNYTM